MSQQTFTFQGGRQYALLTLSVAVNEVQWGDLQQVGADVLKQYEQSATSVLIVDLSQLDYIGSAQVALLVRLWKAVKARDGRMVVQIGKPMVREVLTIAALHTVWELVDTRAAAFRTLGLEHDGRPKSSLAGPLLGILALLLGLAGLYVQFVDPDLASGELQRLVPAAQLVFAVIALTSGVWTVARGAGARRGLGAGVVAASLLLGVAAVLKLY